MAHSHKIGAVAVRRAVAGIAVLVVAGCAGEDITRTFGLVRDAPDEFQVTTRAPLSMPPDFQLRPPRPGAPRPQEQASSVAAESALVPQAALGTTAAPTSAGQQALLSASGPRAPSDIRRKVESEASLDQPNAALTDRLMFWKSKQPPGTVVDANKEAQRLRQNSALGQNIEQGDTPIIQRGGNRPGLLDRIF